MNAHSRLLTSNQRGLSILTVRLWSPHIKAAVEYVNKTPVAGPILDLGCGQANHMRSVPDRSRPVIGIDIDFSRLRKASLDDPHGMLVLADAERLPFCDAAFSGLLSVSLLQYVDHERTLTEVGRVLRSGARTGFVENLYGSPVARIYRILHRALGMRYGSHVTPQHHLQWQQCEGLFNRYIRISSLQASDLTTPLAYVSLVASTLVLRRSSVGRRQLRVLRKADDLLLTQARALARCCWIVSVLGSSP
jgi:SAM-dependent methyltransferase